MLILPVQIFAQEEKLDTKGVYERAIKEYINLHPEFVVTTDSGRFLFLKEEAFTRNLRDTISGTRVVFLNPDSAAQKLSTLFPKKKSFTLVQMNQIFTRSTVYHVYFYSMKNSWNAKTGKLKVSDYDDGICRVDFDFRLENEAVNYYFRESTCNISQ